jgi:phosphoglycerate dehydrogenase-like enzyme
VDVVLITPEGMRDKPAPYFTLLRDAGFQVRYPQNPIFTRGHGGEEETIRELENVSAVLAGGGEHYSPRALAQLPQLRVIARSGVGYDRIDVPAATANDIVVTITPTANHEAVAEHALLLLLALAKDLVVNDRRTRDGTWRTELNTPVRGMVLGIVGLGRIGRSLAVRAKALGLQLIAAETYPDLAFVAEHEIQLVSLDELLRRADYVSVHCPLNSATRGMFNRELFAQMKRGAFFINTARGTLVNEADLHEALVSGQLKGAALDVYEVEPAAADNPLFRLDNVIVTPHIASSDTRAYESMGVEAAQCIVRLYRGDWPEHAVVNNELRHGWNWTRKRH